MTEVEVSDGVRAALADAATWEMPPAALEDQVVAEIRRRRGGADAPASRGPRSGLLLPAVAALLILVLGTAAPLFWPSDGASPQRFALAGTGRAPDASATVTVEETGAGAKIVFDAGGLPAAPPRTYYEAWVGGPDGDKVAIGTFHLHDGDDPIALWAGVEISEYPLLTVTLEPEDGDARSSGDVVLRGSID